MEEKDKAENKESNDEDLQEKWANIDLNKMVKGRSTMEEKRQEIQIETYEITEPLQ